MSNETDLQQVERRAFRASFEDGLIDVQLGAVFVVTLSLLAFFLDYPRLYAYVWFLALMDPFAVWMEAQTGWVFPSGATVF